MGRMIECQGRSFTADTVSVHKKIDQACYAVGAKSSKFVTLSVNFSKQGSLNRRPDTI